MEVVLGIDKGSNKKIFQWVERLGFIIDGSELSERESLGGGKNFYFVLKLLAFLASP